MEQQPAATSAFDFRKILLLLAFLFVLGIVFLLLSKDTLNFSKKNEQTGQVELEYWGLFEPADVFSEVIADYEKNNPNVKINYVPKTYSDLDQFKTTLQIRTQQGTGPDIFRMHATWASDLSGVISPAPNEVITTEEYKNTFYPVAYNNLVLNNRIYAIPLMYDALALFYDPVRFEAAGISKAPETWEQFREAVAKLTEYEEGAVKKIRRSGAAIGVGNNVEHASDIMGLMMAQNGVSFPDDLDSQKAQDVLKYYTMYVKDDMVWDSAFPNSLQAFANGQVAMIFAPSWRVFDILSYNPRLNYRVAPVPQIPRFEERYGRVGWASFWVESVSTGCKNPTEAWKFLKYLSSKEIQQKLYAKEAVLRPFGEFYSRRDLREALMGDAQASAFVADAETAVMWAITDASGNSENVEAVETAIGAIFKNISESAAMKTFKAKITGVPLEQDQSAVQ